MQKGLSGLRRFIDAGFSLVRSDLFLSTVGCLQLCWVFHTCFFVSFQQKKISKLSIWLLLYALHSAFQLQAQEIDRSK